MVQRGDGTPPTTKRCSPHKRRRTKGMPDVRHMKWWGWGVEGVSFHHEDKPALRQFLIKIIDLDVNAPPASPMSLDDLPIPAPMISDQLVVELTDVVGAENAVRDDLDRIVH